MVDNLHGRVTPDSELTVLPSITCLSSTTLSHTAGSANVTKPNPRGCPVDRSFMITASMISPYFLKWLCKLSVETNKIRETTNMDYYYPYLLTDTPRSTPDLRLGIPARAGHIHLHSHSSQPHMGTNSNHYAIISYHRLRKQNINIHARAGQYKSSQNACPPNQAYLSVSIRHAAHYHTYQSSPVFLDCARHIHHGLRVKAKSEKKQRLTETCTLQRIQ